MSVDTREKDERCDKHEPTRARRAWDFTVFLCKDQWFLIGIALVTLIASQVQVPLDNQAVKQVVVSYLSGEETTTAPTIIHS